MKLPWEDLAAQLEALDLDHPEQLAFSMWCKGRLRHLWPLIECVPNAQSELHEVISLLCNPPSVACESRSRP